MNLSISKVESGIDFTRFLQYIVGPLKPNCMLLCSISPFLQLTVLLAFRGVFAGARTDHGIRSTDLNFSSLHLELPLTTIVFRAVY